MAAALPVVRPTGCCSLVDLRQGQPRLKKQTRCRLPRSGIKSLPCMVDLYMGGSIAAASDKTCPPACPEGMLVRCCMPGGAAKAAAGPPGCLSAEGAASSAAPCAAPSFGTCTTCSQSHDVGKSVASCQGLTGPLLKIGSQHQQWQTQCIYGLVSLFTEDNRMNMLVLCVV